MVIFNGKKDDLELVGQEVKKGKIVAFPTDTVYGLGASIEHIESIKRIFYVKNRPLDSPIILLINDLETLEKLAYINDSRVYKLAKEFWPGGLTLILPKKDCVDSVITAGGNSVGIRIPNSKIARELIKYSGGVLATPSANKNGHLSPSRAEHVIKQFSHEEIDYLIDGGKTDKSIESTILDMTGHEPLIIRNGAITKVAIEEIIGKVQELKIKKSNKKFLQKEFIFVTKDNFKSLSKDSILLTLKKTENFGIKEIKFLSENGELEEAIQNLYDVLHDLLEGDNKIIYVEQLADNGLEKVIMERIKKMVK